MRETYHVTLYYFLKFQVSTLPQRSKIKKEY